MPKHHPLAEAPAESTPAKSSAELAAREAMTGNPHATDDEVRQAIADRAEERREDYLSDLGRYEDADPDAPWNEGSQEELDFFALFEPD